MYSTHVPAAIIYSRYGLRWDYPTQIIKVVVNIIGAKLTIVSGGRAGALLDLFKHDMSLQILVFPDRMTIFVSGLRDRQRAGCIGS